MLVLPKPAQWYKNTVIYELYVDKVAQNFQNLTKRLDYFTKLGVDTLWILPHYPSPMIDDGYDVSDYKNIRPELGTIEDFKNFVLAAHQNNIKIITDLVLNHTSSEHPWFKQASSSKNNKYRDYYLWSDNQGKYTEAKNPFNNIKESNWIKNDTTNDYYFATFYPEQPDLNWDNPQVFKEMCNVIDFWLDIGVDGFRLDAIPYLIKREGLENLGLPETHKIIKKIRSHVDKKTLNGRLLNTVLIAESDQPISEAKKYFGEKDQNGNGDECHMAFHFLLCLEIYLYLKNGDRNVLDKVIQESLDIPGNCTWATFLGNHDGFGFHLLKSKDRKDLEQWLDKDFHFTQDIRTKIHDETSHEIDFSAEMKLRTSIRLGEIFFGNPKRIKEAFEVLFRLPGTSVIYYGDEIGMRNKSLDHKPADNRVFVRDDFNWDMAEKQMADPDSIFSFVRNLVKNRVK